MFHIINDTIDLTIENRWTDWTDEDILLEYRYTGIREAFDEIVHRYERELYNYLYRYLGNAANAEDVFQKTFMAVLKGCDKFEAGREFRPWLYRIATNKAVDHLRKAKRFSVISMDAPTGNDQNSCIADTIVGDEPEPWADEMDREIACEVREAVASLPEPMRQAVYMVYFQGLSYREAAEAVGVSFCTVSKRVHQAIGKLNYLLKNVG